MKTIHLSWKVLLPGLLLLLATLACHDMKPGSEVATAAPDHLHLSKITYQTAMSEPSDTNKVLKSDEEWRVLLTASQFRILRQAGTEMPFINEYNSLYDDGVYICAGCGNPLFDSGTKYNSRSGWPSFWEPIREDAVSEREDNSLFMTRTEIICSRCDGHLGHLFNDGPEPTGLRYCMNSAAMKFIPKE